METGSRQTNHAYQESEKADSNIGYAEYPKRAWHGLPCDWNDYAGNAGKRVFHAR